MPFPTLHPGEAYRVIFDTGARLPREATMRFLDATVDHLIFDLRPLAGTQLVLRRNVKAIYEAKGAKLRQPKIHRGEL